MTTPQLSILPKTLSWIFLLQRDRPRISMLNSTWIRELRNFCIPWTGIFSTSLGTPALNPTSFEKGLWPQKIFFPLRCNIPASLNRLDPEIPKVPFVARLDPKGGRKRFQILSTCAGQLLFQPGFSHNLGLKSGTHNAETRWEFTDIKKLWDLDLQSSEIFQVCLFLHQFCFWVREREGVRLGWKIIWFTRFPPFQD